jgi:hypothetical protein
MVQSTFSHYGAFESESLIGPQCAAAAEDRHKYIYLYDGKVSTIALFPIMRKCTKYTLWTKLP